MALACCGLDSIPLLIPAIHDDAGGLSSLVHQVHESSLVVGHVVLSARESPDEEYLRILWLRLIHAFMAYWRVRSVVVAFAFRVEGRPPKVG